MLRKIHDLTPLNTDTWQSGLNIYKSDANNMLFEDEKMQMTCGFPFREILVLSCMLRLSAKPSEKNEPVRIP